MRPDVFLSHSSADAPIAEELRAALETAGIPCWIAPRDVPAGAVWAEAILDGIRASRVFVLVHSARSNDSREVLREVDAAARAKAIIIPFRLEDVPPSGALEFYVNTSQWFDAPGPDRQRHLARLVERLREILGRSPETAPPGPAVTRSGPAPATVRPSMRLWMGLGVVALTTGVALFVTRGPGSASEGTPSPRSTGGAGSPGKGRTPEFEPTWAKVGDVQRAEARRLAVPVAYENGLGMRFVLIPTGRFTMGPGPGKPGKLDSGAAHEVRLTHAFYLQTTEVTNRQYRAFLPDHSSGERDGVSLDGDDQPAVDVNQHDAHVFVGWVTERERRSHRLPTEAEWEYACRAGTNTRYSFGEEEGDAPRYANFGDRASHLMTGSEALNDGSQVSANVGSYLPNPWGLYDMHGNVWEWCTDWLAPYPEGPRVDPVGPVSERVPPLEFRVARGGAWDSPLSRLCSAERHGGKPREAALTVFGFRLCAVVPGQR